MATRNVPMFIWIPPDRNTNWSLTINSIDVTNRVLSATKIPFGLIEEDLHCEIELDNSDKSLDFSENDIIVFKMDYSDASTIQFEGEVESAINNFTQGEGIYKMKIIGSHYSSRLLDILVTKDYTDSTISSIKQDLINTFLVGYTTIPQSSSITSFTALTSFTASSATIEETPIIIITDTGATLSGNINIKFIKAPLVDCLSRLNILGDEDSYIDNNKALNSFKRGSRNNDNEALVIDESMFELKNFGVDNTIKKNKFQIFGDSGGLPVIFSKSNITNVNTRVREQIFEDSNATDETKAEVIVKAEIDRLANPDFEATADIIMTPNLIPGYMTYIIHPDQGVHDRYRVSKFIYMPYDNKMEVLIGRKRTLATLFKDRILKDIGQESISNPFDMNYSYNFTFDDLNKVNSNSSNDIAVEDGKLKMQGIVSTARMMSNTLTTPINVSNVEIRVVGENLTGTTYYINLDNTDNFQEITLNTNIVIDTTITSGNKLRFRINITDSTTRIDSAVVLYK